MTEEQKKKGLLRVSKSVYLGHDFQLRNMKEAHLPETGSSIFIRQQLYAKRTYRRARRPRHKPPWGLRALYQIAVARNLPLIGCGLVHCSVTILDCTFLSVFLLHASHWVKRLPFILRLQENV